MKCALVLAAVLAVGCTHGPAEDHVTVQNVALKPDATLLAVIVKYERSRPATGLSAFPDGGVPRILAQRADLYLIDLPSRKEIHRIELPAPRNRRLSFSPWLIGWAGDRVFFKITGCEGSPGSDCHGPLMGTSLFTLSSAGHIAPFDSLPVAELVSTLDRPSGYVSTGVERYGVSISTRLGAPRTPLLRFVGIRLDVVPSF